MSGEDKLIDQILNFAKILKSGELSSSINSLSNSMHGLNQEIRDLNSIMLKQNEQVSESIKQAKESVEELRKGFEELNNEMKKSTEYFEEMERSSIAMEKLTKVILIFTFLMFSLNFYPILKDILCDKNECNPIAILVLAGISAILILAGILHLLNKKKLK
jgi:seryl-tRNA synthetase